MTTERMDLEGAWTVLETTPPASGLEGVAIGCQVAAGQVLVGLDEELRRHLLVPLMPGEAAATDTRGRGVHLVRVTHGREQYLSLVCMLPELYPVFVRFCRELIDSLESSSSPARAAYDAFENWRYLFSDARTTGPLGEESLVGLIGELLTLNELLTRGASPGISFWRGPLNEPHDFRCGDRALEVKSTLVREGRIVSISGVDQLQEPVGGSLHLRHMRFQPSPKGLDLADLVAIVLAGGADRRALESRLDQYQIRLESLAVYADRRYELSESRIYDVEGEAFPRVTRSSFKGGDLPPGTLRFSYAIDLTNEPPTPLSQLQVDALLDALAGEVTDEVDT